MRLTTAQPCDPDLPQTIVLFNSQVAGSRVGGGVAEAALLAAGYWPQLVPTVVFGRHPGLGAPGGGAVPDAVFAGALDGLTANGARAGARAIATGYFASAAQVAAAAAFIDAARAENPDVLVLVDPICGDGPACGTDEGLYVKPEIARAVADRLVARADLITPNLFELSWLAGRAIGAIEDAADAARSLASCVLVTSAPAGDGRIGVMAADSTGAFVAETARFQTVPQGTGDLFAALALIARLDGRSLRRTGEIAAARATTVIRRTHQAGAADLIVTPAALSEPIVPLASRRLGAQRPAWVMGLDGCPAGWIGVMIDLNGLESPRWRIFPDFRAALEAGERPAVIAVDMPIGFADSSQGPGGRDCEREARALLGPRKASVFASPLRPALEAADYRAALAANRAAGGPGLSKQTWNIVPRMREIDVEMTPKLEGCVHEVHPELAFAALSGAPMASPKRTKAGRAERLEILTAHGLPGDLFDPHPCLRKDAAPDDLLDAAACALSAQRIAEGRALQLPENPPRDARGLRMAIFA